MARPTRWSQLRIGLVALAGVFTLAVLVLRFARVGALHGDTTPLFMITDMATGVIRGTDVWLGGQKVGLVKDVRLLPPSSDTTERVLITMDILNQYLRYIRRNSDVQIRPSGNLIGTPVVFITIGTGRAPALRAGDTLRARAQLENRSSLADLSSLSDTVTALATAFGQIRQDFSATRGEVTRLRRRSERQANEVEHAFNQFAQRATRSQGTVALVLQDSASVRLETHRLAALTDSLRAAAFGGRGNVGRFRRDSSLVLHARHALATADSLRDRALAYAGRPTRGDTALTHELERVHAQLDSLVQDAKHHPFRYFPL